MRLIGYWLRSLLDTEYLAPQEISGILPDDLCHEVAEYLDSGRQYLAYRGHSYCRFYCVERIGCWELTDGKWVWPEGLSHYVRHHRVLLPGEFLRDVASGGSSERSDTEEADLEYWISWCSQLQHPEFRAVLEAARKSAESLIKSEINARGLTVDCQEARIIELTHGSKRQLLEKWSNYAFKPTAEQALRIDRELSCRGGLTRR